MIKIENLSTVYGFIFYRKTFKTGDSSLTVIQCDSGYSNGDLIACARYRIYDLKAKDGDKDGNLNRRGFNTHVLFIIHLPRQAHSSSFISFQGDPWISAHIDDLRPNSDTTVSASRAINLSISELFLGVVCDEDEAGDEAGPDYWVQKLQSSVGGASSTEESPLFYRLYGCIQAATAKLMDVNTNAKGLNKKCTDRVKILVKLIPSEPQNNLGNDYYEQDIVPLAI